MIFKNETFWIWQNGEGTDVFGNMGAGGGGLELWILDKNHKIMQIFYGHKFL
jgi:hypothetical protein